MYTPVRGVQQISLLIGILFHMVSRGMYTPVRGVQQISLLIGILFHMVSRGMYAPVRDVQQISLLIYYFISYQEECTHQCVTCSKYPY